MTEDGRKMIEDGQKMIEDGQKMTEDGQKMTEEGRKMEHKSIHDSIHGTIMLHPLLVAIIDTPQFQRLRDIKQLGGTYLVFPGASHNRFEHCIGTSYLCGEMLSTLKYYHEGEIEITDEDILCVQIAGLCHDLGHGPFSHLFDGAFIPRSSNKSSEWTHEKGSCDLFDHLIQENEKVSKLMEENGIGQVEQNMIKSMIMGETTMGEKRLFLFEIVSNKATGIDCDKFDYFARDTHHVGIKNSFEFKRYFKNIRIMPIKGKLRICARDKEESNLYELFHIRWTLHRQVYQHKTCKAIEEMIAEALRLADNKFQISQATTDMKRFTYMTDSIFFKILESTDPVDEDVVKAKKILQNIQTRELYPFCGEYNLPDSDKEDSEEIVKKIVEAIVQYCKKKKMKIEKDDVCVLEAKFNFGKGEDNPLKNMHFFGKDGKLKVQQEYNGLKPSHFEMKILRVYSKVRGEKSELVKKAFEMWKEKN